MHPLNCLLIHAIRVLELSSSFSEECFDATSHIFRSLYLKVCRRNCCQFPKLWEFKGLSFWIPFIASNYTSSLDIHRVGICRIYTHTNTNSDLDTVNAATILSESFPQISLFVRCQFFSNILPNFVYCVQNAKPLRKKKSNNETPFLLFK